jgi:lipoate-protein ligase A
MLFEKIVEVVDAAPHGAALNMAIDEVLLHTACAPLLRLYGWRQPAVSFGYFGMASRVLPLCDGREPVRRWTGGGVVPHGDDVTYSLIVPSAAAFFRAAPLASYRAIHARIAALIPDATIVETAATENGSGFCFAAPSRHDVTCGGRKIAGAAQRRTRHGLLHQGSVQVVHGRNDFRSSLAHQFAANVLRRELRTWEVEAAERLAAEKYGTEAWLRRR